MAALDGLSGAAVADAGATRELGASCRARYLAPDVER